jgi:hypothetical protein
MRFRKSIKIFPGVKINIGKTGFTSVSVGKPGATVNVSGKGSFLTVGLPGTGLSHRMRLSGGQPGARGSRSARFIGPLDGQAVNEAEYRRQAYLFALNLQRRILPLSADPEEASRRFMPARPHLRIWPILLGAFSVLALATLSWRGAGQSGLMTVAILTLLVSGVCALTDVWRRRRWRRAAGRVRELVESAARGHGAAVEAVFARIVEETFGPQAVGGAVLASPDGSAVSFELNLPSLEELAASVPASRFSKAGIRADRKKEQALREDYQLIAHSTLMFATGEAFRLFPTVRRVIASGWALQSDPATGRTDRGCLVSVVFERGIWGSMNPAGANPVDFTGNFPVRRDIAPDGALRPIQPFPPV